MQCGYEGKGKGGGEGRGKGGGKAGEREKGKGSSEVEGLDAPKSDKEREGPCEAGGKAMRRLVIGWIGLSAVRAWLSLIASPMHTCVILFLGIMSRERIARTVVVKLSF
jgi:hypothetical protein